MAKGEMGLGLVGRQGIENLRRLNEQSFEGLPEIPFKRLVYAPKDRYNDSVVSERKYEEHPIKMKTDVGPEQIGIGALTIDFSRTIVFIAPISKFDSLGFDPKFGDVIFYDEADYEVSKAYRQDESRVGHTNVYLNFVIETVLQRSPHGAEGTE